MSIFDRFNSKEELLKAVESAITSQTVQNPETGESTDYFTLADEPFRELKQKFDTAVKDNQNYRKRAQTAETRVSELEKECSRLQSINDEYSAFNPEKQREEINKQIQIIGTLKSQNEELSKKIEPLTEIIADYKAKENNRLIEQALVDEAAKLGVRPEAMRDVLFRRSLLEVSDIGTIQTKEGAVPIADFMKSEYEASPLWHPVSAGGGSNPGTADNTLSSDALYQQAKKNGDLAGMFANAPEFNGTTLGGTDTQL